MTELLPPQLVIDSRMLYFGWVPADPDAVRRLLPRELRAAAELPGVHEYVRS